MVEFTANDFEKMLYGETFRTLIKETADYAQEHLGREKGGFFVVRDEKEWLRLSNVRTPLPDSDERVAGYIDSDAWKKVSVFVIGATSVVPTVEHMELFDILRAENSRPVFGVTAQWPYVGSVGALFFRENSTYPFNPDQLKDLHQTTSADAAAASLKAARLNCYIYRAFQPRPETSVPHNLFI